MYMMFVETNENLGLKLLPWQDLPLLPREEKKIYLRFSLTPLLKVMALLLRIDFVVHFCESYANSFSAYRWLNMVGNCTWLLNQMVLLSIFVLYSQTSASVVKVHVNCGWEASVIIVDEVLIMFCIPCHNHTNVYVVLDVVVEWVKNYLQWLEFCSA